MNGKDKLLIDSFFGVMIMIMLGIYVGVADVTYDAYQREPKMRMYLTVGFSICTLFLLGALYSFGKETFKHYKEYRHEKNNAEVE